MGGSTSMFCCLEPAFRRSASRLFGSEKTPRSRESIEASMRGNGLNFDMTATVEGTSKSCKVLPWKVQGSEKKFIVYKDEDEHVTPGTLVQETENGFKLASTKMNLMDITTVADLTARPIDLNSPDFQWFLDMMKLKDPVGPDTKPWVIVVMGTPGVGKTTFMTGRLRSESRLASIRAISQEAVKEALGQNVPFHNLFFKQMDDIVAHGADPDFQKLWKELDKIQDPHERLRTYWGNKQHIFTRYVVEKQAGSMSYEFNVSAKMIELLTQPDARYNIAMETTGLSPALVKFGLTANHYKSYNKLVLLVEIDDVEKSKMITHSRLIEEINTQKILGGEQFGDYLDFISQKAKETFKFCQELGETKNKELGPESKDGRWFFHTVTQTFSLTAEHHKRIAAFYKGINYDQQG
mmetsp:Transcript_83114/g.151956  ORF Transcript_83114/g.151956 Transcript_83114/m.151956 type:complete len:409 (-) Transcript_83114:89-1315(-)